MTYLAVLTALPALIKMIIELVKQFETPNSTGEEKKAAVIAVIKAALDALPIMGIQVPTTIILTVVSAVIDAIVLVYNKTGVFHHAKDEVKP